MQFSLDLCQNCSIDYRAEDYSNMSYYNLCGIKDVYTSLVVLIRSQHSNISKGGGSTYKKSRARVAQSVR